jgi:hypothetical protein
MLTVNRHPVPVVTIGAGLCLTRARVALLESDHRHGSAGDHRDRQLTVPALGLDEANE